MMKRQFWLIGIVLLAALSACRSKSKDGPTDTYSSGVIAIAADESFEPIVQENGQLYFKAGGGITAQSRWESEYNEVKQKIYVPIY